MEQSADGAGHALDLLTDRRVVHLEDGIHRKPIDQRLDALDALEPVGQDVSRGALNAASTVCSVDVLHRVASLGPPQEPVESCLAS